MCVCVSRGDSLCAVVVQRVSIARVTGPSAAPTAPAYPVGVMSVPPGGGDMHLAMHTAASLQTLASNPATCELAADLIADVLSRGVDQTTVALTASIPPPAADSFPESHWWDRLQPLVGPRYSRSYAGACCLPVAPCLDEDSEARREFGSPQGNAHRHTVPCRVHSERAGVSAKEASLRLATYHLHSAIVRWVLSVACPATRLTPLCQLQERAAVLSAPFGTPGHEHG